MKQLIERLAKENKNKEHNLKCVHTYKWHHDSEVICCTKGVCVFIRNHEDREKMYKELKGLLKQKGVV